MLLVPCHEQLLLLSGHVEFVPIKHVKRSPGNETFDLIAWLSSALVEVDFGFALSVLRGDAGCHSVVEVTSVAVHFTYCRVEVKKVCFHGLEDRVVVSAMLASTALPALSLVT
ncbi:hypothetical protein D3C81_1434330 [compost metagenome]